MSPRTRGHFLIDGRVQGVCFRMVAYEQAHRLGLTGWVRNRPDGRVETVVEGDPEAVSSYRDWCRRGPSAARVTDLTEDYSEPTGEFSAFQIRHSTFDI